MDYQFRILETTQGQLQANLQVLNTELVELPSKHQQSISRQQFITSHVKSYNRFWDNFRLKAQDLEILMELI